MPRTDIRNFDCSAAYYTYHWQQKKDKIADIFCTFAMAFLVSLCLFAAILIHF